MNHLERHEFLTSLKNVFKYGFSSKSKLLVTLNDCMTKKKHAEGLLTDIVISDFSKVFDKIAHGHNTLLSKIVELDFLNSKRRQVTTEDNR